jgi:two-component system phosphate regulon sensor histidine kinase PhoR
MLRSGLFWKLYAILVALVILVAGLAGVLVSIRIQAESLAEIERSLQARAQLLEEIVASSLTAQGSDDIQARIQSLGDQLGTRLTVLGKDGRVLADSQEQPRNMSNHGSRPEVLAARSQGSGSSVRLSDTLGTEMMYFALPVFANGQLTGYVRTALSTASVDLRLEGLRYLVMGTAGLAAVVALIIGFFLTRSVIRPLSEMTAVAESIASGNYDWQLPDTSRKDEIGKFESALSQMALSSRNRMEKIIANRNELAAILGGMVEGVVAVDVEQSILHMNSVSGGMLGASPEESLGKKIWDVTKVKEVADVLTDVLKGGTEIKRKLRITGTPRDEVIEMHSSPLLDGDGKVTGAIVVLHDVTELHRLENVRKDFVGNVSHELKTPITAVRALAETLMDDSEMDSAVRKRFLGKIREQSFRLSSIVTDLLTLSRLESEGGAIQFSELDLRETVRASVKALQSTGEGRGVQVESDLRDAPIQILGDEEALGQMVTNLLDNALKYTPEGGRVWVQLRAEGQWAIVEVHDTGIGIEPAEQERIFERFYRVDKARSRELGGTGLGLSIVKHIARTHKGDVTVESSLGAGSSFIIRLPLSPVAVSV